MLKSRSGATSSHRKISNACRICQHWTLCPDLQSGRQRPGRRLRSSSWRYSLSYVIEGICAYILPAYPKLLHSVAVILATLYAESRTDHTLQLISRRVNCTHKARTVHSTSRKVPAISPPMPPAAPNIKVVLFHGLFLEEMTKKEVWNMNC